jgi:hypothetical protein
MSFRPPVRDLLFSAKHLFVAAGGGKISESDQILSNYRHGFYTAKAIAERRSLRALIRKLAG